MNKALIRQHANDGIRAFVRKQAPRMYGRTLDYGCGLSHRCTKVSPYREFVSGEYVPYDIGYPNPVGPFAVVLCTQVLQFVGDPASTLRFFAEALHAQTLILTYSTCWEEIENDDYWRFTWRGMEKLVRGVGYTHILEHEPLWATQFDDFNLVGGYGLVCCR